MGEFDVLGIVLVGEGGGNGRGGEEGEEPAAVLAHGGDCITGGGTVSGFGSGWGDETNPGVVESFCFRASFRARWVRWKSDWIWLE